MQCFYRTIIKSYFEIIFIAHTIGYITMLSYLASFFMLLHTFIEYGYSYLILVSVRQQIVA